MVPSPRLSCVLTYVLLCATYALRPVSYIFTPCMFLLPGIFILVLATLIQCFFTTSSVQHAPSVPSPTCSPLHTSFTRHIFVFEFFCHAKPRFCFMIITSPKAPRSNDDAHPKNPNEPRWLRWRWWSSQWCALCRTTTPTSSSFTKRASPRPRPRCGTLSCRSTAPATCSRG